MKIFKKLLLIVLLLFLLVYCIFFAVKNSQLVPVDLIFVDPLKLPVSMISLGLLALGFILGTLLSLFNLFMKNMKIKRLKRQLESLRKQAAP